MNDTEFVIPAGVAFAFAKRSVVVSFGNWVLHKNVKFVNPVAELPEYPMPFAANPTKTLPHVPVPPGHAAPLDDMSSCVNVKSPDEQDPGVVPGGHGITFGTVIV